MPNWGVRLFSLHQEGSKPYKHLLSNRKFSRFFRPLLQLKRRRKKRGGHQTMEEKAADSLSRIHPAKQNGCSDLLEFLQKQTRPINFFVYFFFYFSKSLRDLIKRQFVCLFPTIISVQFIGPFDNESYYGLSSLEL